MKQTEVELEAEQSIRRVSSKGQKEERQVIAAMGGGVAAEGIFMLGSL